MKRTLIFCALGMALAATAVHAACYVFCEGNSITAGMGANPRETYSYPAQLATMQPANKFVNGGLSGDCIYSNTAATEILTNLAAATGYAQRAVVLEFGLNDIAQNERVATIETNFVTCIKNVRTAHPDVKIIGCTNHYINWGGPGTYESKRIELNTWIRSSGVFDGIVDIAATTVFGTDYTNLTYYDRDQVHLCNNGYTVYANAVATVLQSMGLTGTTAYHVENTTKTELEFGNYPNPLTAGALQKIVLSYRSIKLYDLAGNPVANPEKLKSGIYTIVNTTSRTGNRGKITVIR